MHEQSTCTCESVPEAEADDEKDEVIACLQYKYFLFKIFTAWLLILHALDVFRRWSQQGRWQQHPGLEDLIDGVVIWLGYAGVILPLVLLVASCLPLLERPSRWVRSRKRLLDREGSVSA